MSSLVIVVPAAPGETSPRFARVRRRLLKALARAQRSAGEPGVAELGLAHLAALVTAGPAPKKVKLEPDLRGRGLLLALLGDRLQAVYGAGQHPWPEDQVEHVHDLRVATRRFREALAVAAPLLPEKGYARANRAARELGRRFGARRTIDVLLEDLRAQLGGGVEAVHARFEALLLERQAEVTDVLRDELPPGRMFRRGLRALELALSPVDERTTLAELAGPHLAARTAAVEPLLTAIEVPELTERHHRLRIALKHLRYAAEILGEAFPTLIRADETVSPLRKLQDALGALNDAKELLALARKLTGTPRADGGDAGLLLAEIESVTRARYQAAREAVHGLGQAVVESLSAATADLRRDGRRS